MGHWLPGQAIVQAFNGVASCGDLLVIKPWINVLQMGSLLMNRKGFESWETLNAGTIKACNVCLHFNIIVCLSTSRLPGPQLVDNNQLQRQVCPLGCVLSWKKWVYFVDYSSWLLPVQWLPHCMFLEGGAGPIWEFQGHGRAPPLQGALELPSRFTPGLVWATVLKEWWLLASCSVLNFDTINIWSHIISYCQGLSLALRMFHGIHISSYLMPKVHQKNQKVSRHCQMSLEDKTAPS